MKRIKKRKGWRGERARHSLARKGIRTGTRKKKKKKNFKKRMLAGWEKQSEEMNKAMNEMYLEAEKYK